MPKVKTHRGAAKRFSITKTGKVKRGHAYRRHKLNIKTRKTKRNLRLIAFIDKTEEKNIKVLIPYK